MMNFTLRVTLMFVLCMVFSVAVGGVAQAQGKYETFARDPKGQPVEKQCDSPCGCTCKPVIERNHIKIRGHMTDEFIKHRTWMIDEFFNKHVLNALALMTSQLSNVAVQHTYSIGKFFDAKHQMETQRILQKLMAEAHKDYQPSEGICTIGTTSRALASSQRKSNVAQVAFARHMSDRALQTGDVYAAEGPETDVLSRIELFRSTYCNKQDNAGGLGDFCEGYNPPRERVNKDVDFTRTVLGEQTLEANFLNEQGAPDEIDEQDVFALSSNLFAVDLPPVIDRDDLATADGRPRADAYTLMDIRAVEAKRSVAQNAFAALVAERISGYKGEGDNKIDYSHMKRLIVDLGVDEKDIDKLVGVNPSYYAQRKVLSSYAYETPDFYTQLYESPTNVSRKEVALNSINLMLEDDMFDRQLESESMLAILLETMLYPHHVEARRTLTDLEPGGE